MGGMAKCHPSSLFMELKRCIAARWGCGTTMGCEGSACYGNESGSPRIFEGNDRSRSRGFDGSGDAAWGGGRDAGCDAQQPEDAGCDADTKPREDGILGWGLQPGRAGFTGKTG